MSLDILIQAIKERKSISFEYNKLGKTPGVRIGDPHAVFVMRKKDGSESTKAHIVQTGGVTDSEPDFPEFRTFDILELSNLKILNGPFPINDKYNPNWDGYAYVIEKV